MIRYTISKTDGTYLDHGDFNSEAEAREFYAPRFKNGVYGKESSTYEALVSEAIAAVLDEEGNEISPEVPAVYETVTIPAEFVINIKDLSEEIATEAAKEAQRLKIEAGKKAREVCTQVLDLISGDNLDKELTLEQITEMQSVFGNIEKALQSSRPTLAKIMISSVEADGILISEQLKLAALELLSEY